MRLCELLSRKAVDIGLYEKEVAPDLFRQFSLE